MFVAATSICADTFCVNDATLSTPCPPVHIPAGAAIFNGIPCAILESTNAPAPGFISSACSNCLKVIPGVLGIILASCSSFSDIESTVALFCAMVDATVAAGITVLPSSVTAGVALTVVTAD